MKRAWLIATANRPGDGSELELKLHSWRRGVQMQQSAIADLALIFLLVDAPG